MFVNWLLKVYLSKVTCYIHFIIHHLDDGHILNSLECLKVEYCKISILFSLFYFNIITNSWLVCDNVEIKKS